MKYRKKPVVIEAVQWTGELTEVVPAGVCRMGDTPFKENYAPHVHAMHNNQAVLLEPGDWIIPEPDGEHYYPCKPDVFDQTYEPAKAVTGTTGLAQVYVDALEGLGISLIDGQPMVCEQHPWRLWPHGDDDCAGPGMPLSAAEGSFGKVARFQ